MADTRKRIFWIIIVALLLTIPFVMIFSKEVQWEEAIAYSIIILAFGATYALWQWLKTHNRNYRFAFVLGLAGLFFLIMVNGAVGMIGSDNNPANLLYWAVISVGLTGTLLARLKSRGMALTLFTMAVTQILIPLFALVIWPAKGSWGEVGVIGVFIVNMVFVILFFVSGWLFWRASTFNRLIA